MSATQNMEVVRRAVEAIWNRGELDVADVLFASDYVNHHGLILDLVHRTAFPDAHITVEEAESRKGIWSYCAGPRAAYAQGSGREVSPLGRKGPCRA